MKTITIEFNQANPAVLLRALATEGTKVSIEGWTLIRDDAGIWMTNPYGVDVGLVRPDEAQCGFILETIKETGSCEREWGHL